jgi:sugar-phosphatase
MPITEAQCKQTMGMRFKEVIEIWRTHFNTLTSVEVIENTVMTRLLELIDEKGKFIEGIPEILTYLSSKEIPMGLATSSSTRLMNAILAKLQITDLLQAKTSAESLLYGKPHPEVFLRCAAELGIAAKDCIVIEDSLNGVIAAKAAQMQVIAVPDSEHTKQAQFALADYKFEAMTEVLPLLRQLF